jgi:hypothetical protein
MGGDKELIDRLLAEYKSPRQCSESRGRKQKDAYPKSLAKKPYPIRITSKCTLALK